MNKDKNYKNDGFMNKDNNKRYILRLILILGIFLTIGFISTMIHKYISSEDTETYTDISTVMAAPGGFIHPNMYINAGEIEIIKGKIASNQQPWKAAYDKMMSQANGSLRTPIQSVTFGGKIPSSGDMHDYFTEGPYLSDGVYNPKADRTDYTSAIKMRDSVRSLGMAYAFTGDSKYADKAVQLIRAWAIDPDTKLNPKFTNMQSHIEIAITMSGMFYGIDLIWNYPGFGSGDKEAIKSWAKNFSNSGKTFSSNENFDLWRLVFISSASVIAEDTDSLNYVFDRWKYDINDQMDTEGKIIREINRPTGLGYSISGVNGFIITAELARHYGVDLYNYKTSDDKGLELTLNFHAPYVINPSTWPRKQIRPYIGQNAGTYELAYSWKKKDSYKNAISRWGRPMYEDRALGYVTLTHTDTNITIGEETPTRTSIIDVTPTPVSTPMTPTTITPREGEGGSMMLVFILSIFILLVLLLKNHKK